MDLKYFLYSRYQWNYLTTIIYLADKKIVGWALSEDMIFRKGNCGDNAVADSFFKTIKHEWHYRFENTTNDKGFESINQYIAW